MNSALKKMQYTKNTVGVVLLTFQESESKINKSKLETKADSQLNIMGWGTKTTKIVLKKLK